MAHHFTLSAKFRVKSLALVLDCLSYTKDFVKVALLILKHVVLHNKDLVFCFSTNIVMLTICPHHKRL